MGDWDSGPASPAPLIDFETLFALAPNPYVLLDPAFRIVAMNAAYLGVTMRQRDDLVGRVIFDAFPADPTSNSFKLLEGSLRRARDSGQADEIALIRYDIPRPDGSMDVRYWSATHTPLKDASGTVTHILQHTVDVTELHGLRRMRDEMGLVQRAQAVQTRNQGLAEEAERFKTLFEQAPGFVAILDGPEHRFVLANRAYREIVGEKDVVGQTVSEALPEIVEQGFIELLDGVRASGEPYVGSHEKVFLGGAGAGGRFHYLDFIYQPIFSPSGHVSGIFVQGYDVTEEVEAEERQQLLINELNHRVKNTLAIVQGLAMQSFRQIEGSEGARRTFDARLNALSAAHSLLTARNWEASQLVDTMRNSIVATAGQEAERFHLNGPDIRLQPQIAVSLAMMVHELSTNAIKYGALAGEDGQVRIDWTIAQDGDHNRLEIDWRESGGPPVAEPSRRGFGTRLIQRGMSGENGSSVTMEFLPQGLRCTIRATLPREGGV